MTLTLRATNGLVAVAWISSIPGLTADVVATQLPTDESKWAAHGAIVVPVAVGGNPHTSIPVHRPVLQIECWATAPNSDKLPRWKVNQLAEQLYLATVDRTTLGRALTVTANGVPYPTATVKGAVLRTEPRPIWSDVGDYAGLACDLELHWIQVGEVIA